MTNLSKVIFYLLVPAVCLALLCCQTFRTGGKGCDYGVIWMPKSDCKQLKDTLKPYDQSLYLVRTFKKGNIVSPDIGTLKSTSLAPWASTATSDATQKKFSGCAVQAGPYGTSSTTQVPINNLADLQRLKDILNCNTKK